MSLSAGTQRPATGPSLSPVGCPVLDRDVVFTDRVAHCRSRLAILLGGVSTALVACLTQDEQWVGIAFIMAICATVATGIVESTGWHRAHWPKGYDDICLPSPHALLHWLDLQDARPFGDQDDTFATRVRGFVSDPPANAATLPGPDLDDL